jgi:hypothetical protein
VCWVLLNCSPNMTKQSSLPLYFYPTKTSKLYVLTVYLITGLFFKCTKPFSLGIEYWTSLKLNLNAAQKTCPWATNEFWKLKWRAFLSFSRCIVRNKWPWQKSPPPAIDCAKFTLNASNLNDQEKTEKLLLQLTRPVIHSSGLFNCTYHAMHWIRVVKYYNLTI